MSSLYSCKDVTFNVPNDVSPKSRLFGIVLRYKLLVECCVGNSELTINFFLVPSRPKLKLKVKLISQHFVTLKSTGTSWLVFLDVFTHFGYAPFANSDNKHQIAISFYQEIHDQICLFAFIGDYGDTIVPGRFTL